MKLLPTLIAIVAISSGLVPQSAYGNGYGSSFLENDHTSISSSRSKRDLIGFNRMVNNQFSHKRDWNNRIRSDDDVRYARSKMMDMFEQERRAARALMRKENYERLLERLSYLKQQCKCRMICTGPQAACEEMMAIDERLAKGLY